MIHRCVNSILIKLALVCHRTQNPIISYFFEACFMSKVGLSILDLIWESGWFINILSTFLQMFTLVCRGICCWRCTHKEICFWKTQLLFSDHLGIWLVNVTKIFVNRMLKSLILKILIWVFFNGFIKNWTCWDTRLEFIKLFPRFLLFIAFLFWRVEARSLNGFVFHWRLSSDPACLAKTLFGILDTEGCSLSFDLLWRNWLWMNHVSFWIADIKMRCFHNSLLLLNRLFCCKVNWIILVWEEGFTCWFCWLH